MNSPLNGWKAKMALAACGTTMGLLLSECGFRMLKPGGGEFVLDASIGSIPADLYQPDPDLKTVLKPNVQVVHQSIETHADIRTNSLGVRGPEPSLRREDEIRILNIGDSFTLGIQVAENETASQQLATHLSRDWNRTVTGWNAGVDGYGTQQATELARRLIPDLKPDLIVLRFYLGNDLRDNDRWAARSKEAPPIMAEGGPSSERWNGVHRFMSRWSRLYAHLLAWNAMRRAASDPRLQEMADELTPYVDAQARLRLLPATQAAFQQLSSLCEEVSIPCVISWVPPAHVIHTERADATFDIFGLNADHSDPKAVLDSLQSIVPKNLTSCDPTSALSNGAQNEELYFVFDPHWTAAGHRVAATAEAQCIQSAFNVDRF